MGAYYTQGRIIVKVLRWFSLSKISLVATTVPSSTNIIIGTLVYQGIPLDLGPNNSTTVLGLCFPSDYR